MFLVYVHSFLVIGLVALLVAFQEASLDEGFDALHDLGTLLGEFEQGRDFSDESPVDELLVLLHDLDDKCLDVSSSVLDDLLWGLFWNDVPISLPFFVQDGKALCLWLEFVVDLERQVGLRLARRARCLLQELLACLGEDLQHMLDYMEREVALRLDRACLQLRCTLACVELEQDDGLHHGGLHRELFVLGQVCRDHTASEFIDDVDPAALELALVERLEAREYVVELLRQSDCLPGRRQLRCSIPGSRVLAR